MIVSIKSDFKLEKKYRDGIKYFSNDTDELFEDNDIHLNFYIYITPNWNSEKEVTFDNTLAYIEEHKDGYRIVIHSRFLKYFDDKNYVEIFGVFYHEMLHAFDMYMTKSNKAYDFTPIQNYSDMFDFQIDLGFRFWTEFYAYYKSYHFCYNENFSQLTLYYLAKEYKSLIKKRSYLTEYALKGDYQVEPFGEYERKVKNFVYKISMYLAFECRNPKNYEYSQKTQEQQEFKKINKISTDLLKLTSKMIRNTYGKYEFKRLNHIGYYLLKNVYSPLSLEPVLYHKKMILAFRY